MDGGVFRRTLTVLTESFSTTLMNLFLEAGWAAFLARGEIFSSGWPEPHSGLYLSH